MKGIDTGTSLASIRFPIFTGVSCFGPAGGSGVRIRISCAACLSGSLSLSFSVCLGPCARGLFRFTLLYFTANDLRRDHSGSVPVTSLLGIFVLHSSGTLLVCKIPVGELGGVFLCVLWSFRLLGRRCFGH